MAIEYRPNQVRHAQSLDEAEQTPIDRCLGCGQGLALGMQLHVVVQRRRTAALEALQIALVDQQDVVERGVDRAEEAGPLGPILGLAERRAGAVQAAVGQAVVAGELTKEQQGGVGLGHRDSSSLRQGQQSIGRDPGRRDGHATGS